MYIACRSQEKLYKNKIVIRSLGLYISRESEISQDKNRKSCTCITKFCNSNDTDSLLKFIPSCMQKLMIMVFE